MWIQSILVEKGYKLTEPRLQVAAWIETHHKPFSVADVVESYPQLDRVSIYRTVDLLAALDIIHPTLQLHGHQFYEIHEAKKHHHHVMCTGCEKAACVPCGVKQKTVRGFGELHHEVHFTSLCHACLN